MQDFGNAEAIGRVVGLWRYPVKSMGPQSLASVDVGWHGVAGDRRFAFIRSGMAQSGFPWATLRERADMCRYRPSFIDADRPDTSATRVHTPSGEMFDVADPGLAQQISPGGAQVIRQARGIFDSFPLSLITTQTISQLGEMVGTALDVQRFRPNFLIDAADGTPFAEDAWVGKVLRIGGLRMRVDKRDGRCVVITIDPLTMERNPTILRTVASARQGCLGVYGTTVEPGRITVGDLVVFETP